MTTTITNYTTYDLEYYYADLKRLPRLSREERHSLLTGMSGVPTSPEISQDDTQVRRRLIESYLPYAKHLAFTLCPPARSRRLFPDLIGAVNLAVVEATMRGDFGSTLNLDAYVAAYMRGAIKRTLVTDDLLPIPSGARQRARAEGTIAHLYTQQRAQVDTHLSYLSPRAQAILRLRYGLNEDNERAHSPGEIARAFGISRLVVEASECDALARLRGLVTGQASIVTRKGKACISLPGCRTPTVNPAREAHLVEVCTHLQAQGVPTIASLLAQETGIPRQTVGVFLRLHPEVDRARGGQHAQQDQQQARLHHLEAAYGQLVAQGERITFRLLAQAAHVGKSAAMEFQRTQRGKSAPRSVSRSSSLQEVRVQESQARLEQE